MTLRDDVRSMLAGDSGPAAPGLVDLPAELVGTVLGHFADTAPIDEATALSPILMATSPVPFDPQLDGVDPVDDPLAELIATEAGTEWGSDRDDAGDVDVDPVLLDRVDDVGDASDPSAFDAEPAVAVGEQPAGDEGWAESGPTFGLGAGAADDAGRLDAPESVDIDEFVDVSVTNDIDDFIDPVDDLEDDSVIGVDLFEVDVDALDVDPMDDGFDLAD